MTSDGKIRLLYWTREEFPTFRIDIDVLFGRELIGRGHAIDLVMQAESMTIAPGAQPWHGRTVFVGSTASGSVVARFTKHWKSFWHDFRSLSRARRKEYDAIQFRDTFVIAAIGTYVARWRGLKCFYWLSFPYPEADRQHARDGDTRFPMLANLRGVVTGWLLYRVILPRCDHAFVQSEQMRRDIAAHGIPVSHMTPVPMGIDLADVPPQLPVPLRADGAVTLGYLGVLNADRHLDTLIDMLAILLSGGANVRLLLIGDAMDVRDREVLLARASERGVADRMEITGNLPRLQALERMREVDIGISPYYPIPMFLSTSPTKLIEYLALGVPVVASAHPEQFAVVRESKAGVCTPWGARHFARGVRFLLKLSTAERAAMAARGRAYVEQHRTYRRIADNLEGDYRRLLQTTALRTRNRQSCAS